MSLFSDISTKITPAVDTLQDNASKSMTHFKRLISDEPPDIERGPPGPKEPETIQQMSMSEEMSSIFNLSTFQRIALFAMVFATGILLIAMSGSFLPFLVVAPHKFAAAFTVGNLLAICSTWFLVGPKAQLASMFSPGRIIAASVYVCSLVVTLFAAFFGGKLRYILVIIAIVAQVLSLCWYALSYVPYGRQMVSRVISMVRG